MTIKGMFAVYVDEFGYVQVDKENSPSNTSFWLNPEGLKVLRNKINVLLGEQAKESTPDPNLLIDYLKEQAAEEPFECKEQLELIRKFEEWLCNRSRVILLDWGRIRTEFMIFEVGDNPSSKLRGEALGRGMGLLNMMKVTLTSQKANLS